MRCFRDRQGRVKLRTASGACKASCENFERNIFLISIMLQDTSRHPPPGLIQIRNSFCIPLQDRTNQPRLPVLAPLPWPFGAALDRLSIILKPSGSKVGVFDAQSVLKVTQNPSKKIQSVSFQESLVSNNSPTFLFALTPRQRIWNRSAV